MDMKKLILLFMLAMSPLYSWAVCSGANNGDVFMTNLPDKILVNAGSYTAGTVLYDSGKISPRKRSCLTARGASTRFLPGLRTMPGR